MIVARDPLGESLEYAIARSPMLPDLQWQPENTLSLMVTQRDVGVDFPIYAVVRSTRQFHAWSRYDDYVEFGYEVLPPR